MGAAGAAPEILVISDLLVGLVFLLTFAVLAGLLWSYRNTFGWLFERVSGFSIHIPLYGRLRPLAIFGTIDHAFVSALSSAAAKQQKRAGRFFHAAAVVQGWVVRELRNFAVETWGWAKWFQHVYLPTYIHGLHILGKVGTTVTRVVVHKVTATTTRVERVVTQRIGLNRTQVKALIAAAIGLALPAPWAWPSFRKSIRDIAAWRRVTQWRLSRLEKLLAASGLALAVARMTGTSFRCWRGQGNIARALRHICGLPKWLIDLAILGSVETFIATDLCAFSALLIQEAEAVRPALLELVDVENALLACSGVSDLAHFDLPPLSLPPMPGTSLLAA